MILRAEFIPLNRIQGDRPTFYLWWTGETWHFASLALDVEDFTLEELGKAWDEAKKKPCELVEMKIMPEHRPTVAWPVRDRGEHTAEEHRRTMRKSGGYSW